MILSANQSVGWADSSEYICPVSSYIKRGTDFSRYSVAPIDNRLIYTHIDLFFFVFLFSLFPSPGRKEELRDNSKQHYSMI